MWSIACYPSYTPEGGLPRARRIFRRYLPAEILTYLIINFLWAGLSLCLISTLEVKVRRRAEALRYATDAEVVVHRGRHGFVIDIVVAVGKRVVAVLRVGHGDDERGRSSSIHLPPHPQRRPRQRPTPSVRPSPA